MTELRNLLRNLFRKSRLEGELDAELRFHLEQQIARNIARGMTPQDARYAALRAFGGVEQVKEASRDARGTRFLEDFIQDVRYGARVLRRSPGFVFVAVLSLALGIGANTAIFSLLSQASLEPLPVANPSELVQIILVSPSGARFSNLTPEFRSLLENRQSFSAALTYAKQPMNLQFGDQSERVPALLVSGSFYSTLGVNAFLGRIIGEADDQPSVPPVAVLSYAFWKRRFAQDPSMLGKTLFLDGRAFTIVGVTPPEFFGVDRLSAPDVTVPLAVFPPPYYAYCLGRLKPGVSLEQGRAELAVSLRQVLETAQDTIKDWSPRDRQEWLGLKADLNRAAAGTWDLQVTLSERVPVLMLSVGVLLLIACLNVANLLLSRIAARTREISVRLALGAGRGRLCRQLLTESVLLSLAGGLLGLLFAFWGHDLLVSFLPIDPSAAVRFHLDVRILAFTAAVAILTGILFGTLPALRATRLDPYPALKGEAPRAVGAGRLRLRPTRTLLVVQLAASLVLLVGAMLFVRTLHNLQTLDSGFDTEHILLLTIDPTQSRFRGERVTALYDELTNRVRAIPGVRSAALAEGKLFGSGSWQKTLWVEGYRYALDENQYAAFNVVSPGFFSTAGIPLLAGRDFGPQDRAGAPLVAIVNQAFVQKYFQGQNPIGRRFGDEGPASAGKYEIIGVVKDSKYWSLRERPRPSVFHSMAQVPESGALVLHVRTAGAPAAMASLIRQEIQALDKNLVVYNVRTMTEQVDATLRDERMFATLSTFFGALALLLACVGLYGVAAYSLTHRTNEIGIRMALGAHPGDVLWLVLKENLLLVAIGAVIGTPVALACARVVSSLLFGLTPADPASVITGILVLAGVALVACLLPAWRASRVNPLVALRYE